MKELSVMQEDFRLVRDACQMLGKSQIFDLLAHCRAMFVSSRSMACVCFYWFISNVTG